MTIADKTQEDRERWILYQLRKIPRFIRVIRLNGILKFKVNSAVANAEEKGTIGP